MKISLFSLFSSFLLIVRLDNCHATEAAQSDVSVPRVVHQVAEAWAQHFNVLSEVAFDFETKRTHTPFMRKLAPDAEDRVDQSHYIATSGSYRYDVDQRVFRRGLEVPLGVLTFSFTAGTYYPN